MLVGLMRNLSVMRRGGRYVHTGSLDSLECALGVVGFIQGP